MKDDQKTISNTSLVIHSEGLYIDASIVKSSYEITSNWVQIIPLNAKCYKKLIVIMSWASFYKISWG
jgi:hypothetical protein